MFNITSIDINGMVLQTVSSEHEYILETGKHPDGVDFIQSAPNTPESWWDGTGWHEKGQPPSRKHQWNPALKVWVDFRTLQDFKDAQWATVRSERDTRETAGFPYLGKTIDSDPRSVQRINTAVQAAQAAAAANQPFTLFWTCQDNTTLELDATGMMEMPVALAVYANSLHETARTLRAQIDAATTPEAVEAITWPVTS